MAISKVTLNGTTLIDLTEDTVTSDDMKSGTTATASDGQKITGSLPTWQGGSY